MIYYFQKERRATMKRRDYILLKEAIERIEKEDADILAWIVVGLIAKHFSTPQKPQSKSRMCHHTLTNEELEEELYATLNEK